MNLEDFNNGLAIKTTSRRDRNQRLELTHVTLWTPALLAGYSINVSV